MTLEQVIGLTIRGIRKRNGMYCKDLADRVPMSRSYLSEIEHGHKTPSVGLLGDLAIALDLDVADLWYFIYRNLKGMK